MVQDGGAGVVLQFQAGPDVPVPDGLLAPLFADLGW